MPDTNSAASAPFSGFGGLQEIWEPPEPAIGAIFGEIPKRMGAPGVHLLWRLLANFPAYLEAAWPSLLACFSSPEADKTALMLRRAAFIVEAVGLPSHKAFRGDLVRAEIDAEFRARIERFNRDSQIALARLLVLSAVLRDGARSDRPVAGSVAPAPSRRDFAADSRSDPPTPAVYVPPLKSGEARGKALEVLTRVHREHNLPFLDDYYRSLARIPEFLSAAWNAIRPLVGDPEYAARAARLTETATASASTLAVDPPSRSEIEALEPERAVLLAALLDRFVDEVLPQTLVDVTLIMALTSGPQQAIL